MEKTAEPGVFKRGSKYVVVYYANGKQRKESAPTLLAAKKLKRKRQSEADAGKIQEVSREPYAKFAAAWIERYHGKPGREFRESTREDYRRDLKYSIEFFGPRKQLGQITAHDVARFVAWLNDPIAQGRQLAPSTLRNKVAPLAACLGTAFDEQLIAANPAAHVNYPGKTITATIDGGDLDGETDEDHRALTTEQLAWFLEIVNPRYRLMFEFLASTGLRVGELCALQWRHVDLDGESPSVRVRRQVYRGRVQPPKRNSRRDLPLALEMADALRAFRATSKFASDTDLVFPNRSGGALHQSNVSSRYLKPAMTEAGAEWAGFHTFRHTCASMLFDQGRNILQVSKWLGHHSPDFTLRTYVHLMDNGKGEALGLPRVAMKVAMEHTETNRNAETEQSAKTLIAMPIT